MNILTFERCLPDYYNWPPYEVVARNIAYITEMYDWDYRYSHWTKEEHAILMTTLVLISGEKLYVAGTVQQAKLRLRCCDL